MTKLNNTRVATIGTEKAEQRIFMRGKNDLKFNRIIKIILLKS